MKKIITVLSLIFILSSATFVSATTYSVSGPCINFSDILFSGKQVYTSYGANYTTKAVVRMQYSGISGVSTTVQSSSGKTSGPIPLNAYSDGLFTNVYNYPGEGVRAAFIKNNINSGYQFDGQFYYNNN